MTKGIIMQKNFFLFFFFDLNVYYMYELECQFRVSLEIGGKLIQLILIQNFYILTSEPQQMSKNGVSIFKKN